MHTLLHHAVLAQADGGGGASGLGLLVPLVLMGVLFYFLLIRPQQRRARAQRDLISSVEVGDEIMTAGGILGTVTAMDDDDELLTVEVAPGTRIRVVKRAVSQRFVEEDEAGEELDDDDDGDGTADAADEVGDDSKR
jgi:preprotein translocase subunit YajC